MPPRRTPPAARAVHFAGPHPTPEQHAEVLASLQLSPELHSEVLQNLQMSNVTPVDAVDLSNPSDFFNGEAAIPHSSDALAAVDALSPSGAIITASPNPFLSSPYQFTEPLGVLPSLTPPSDGQNVANSSPLRVVSVHNPPPPSGLFPDFGATPPQFTSPIRSDLQSATSPIGQTPPNGGTQPASTLDNSGLLPVLATAIASRNSTTMSFMPVLNPPRDAPPSNPTSAIDRGNINLSQLDAGHIFDAIFTDLPSLDWLRPAWNDHDLNGRAILHMQPPHLADVLVDLELSSSRYISSRHQKLSIARAIYRLMAADQRSSPNNVAAWDSHSLHLPPITNLLAHVRLYWTTPSQSHPGAPSNSPPLHRVLRLLIACRPHRLYCFLSCSTTHCHRLHRPPPQLHLSSACAHGQSLLKQSATPRSSLMTRLNWPAR